MPANESYRTGPSHLSGSEQRGSSSSIFLPSARLKDRMEKLAHHRIDPRRIIFPKDAYEFHGGSATVSQAFLSPPSDYEDTTGESEHPEDKGFDSVNQYSTPDQQVRPLKQYGQGDNAHRGEKEKNEGKEGDRGHEDQEHEHEYDDEMCGWKDIAVKKIRIADNTDLERVLGLALREAEFLVELPHENIITLEGFVEDLSDNKIWLIFPWHHNGNLKVFIASNDWEIPERISLINDVTAGVEFLHGQEPPICHGDLKSLNILVNSTYRAVITDFGSARRLSNQDLRVPAEYDENQLRSQPGLPSPVATYCASTNAISLTANNYTLRWAAPELSTHMVKEIVDFPSFLCFPFVPLT